MTRSGEEYIHGTSAGEQKRLSALNALINQRSLAALALTGGESIVDFGSGLAQFCEAMARTAGPSGRVVGIENSAAQIDGAIRRLTDQGHKIERSGAESDDPPSLRAGVTGGAVIAPLELRLGDVARPPLDEGEWGRFDVAHARFLLEHVERPAEVVRTMVRAVRPGGRVVLEDDDHDVLRLSPDAPRVSRLWRAYFESYAARGRDPFVGRRLVALLAESGARPTRAAWLNFSSCCGEPVFAAMAANLADIFIGAREAVLAGSRLSDREFDEALEELREWRTAPDAVLWYATCWAEGARPER